MKLRFLAPVLFALTTLSANSQAPNIINPEDLLQQRVQLDQTVWADEREAQEYEKTVTKLWDDLLVAEDPYDVFLALVFDSFTYPRKSSEGREWEQGIQDSTFDEGGATLDLTGFRDLARTLKKADYEIEMTEWHHAEYTPKEKGGSSSTISATLYVKNPSLSKRYILKVKVGVEWTGETDSNGNPTIKNVQIDSFRVLERSGAPPFRVLGAIKPETSRGDRLLVESVIAYDLNRDGLSEVILGGCNQILWNAGNDRLRREKLLPKLAHPVLGKVVADFTGDGVPDYLCVNLEGQLFLHRGEGDKPFGDLAEECWSGRLDHPQISAFTGGDIDRDGDLDLWIGQYKDPYTGGQMPTPFYDANDGNPSYLLINDGDGKFTDGTEAAGLAPKRYRRTYSDSFVDLDDDGDLDLLTVNDYAGVDLFHNDGEGRFEDVTERLVDNQYLFGMSHVFGDFDLDGSLDIFAMGMGSTTARRLEQLELGPKEGWSKEVTEHRMDMGYGNRMYLSRNGKWEQPSFMDQVARTGWSWGCTALDVENDGDLDVYVNNGHSSGKSTQDYCTRFWCHDIYANTSKENSALDRVFGLELDTLATYSTSWNGYEKNAFLLNDGGKGFVNASYLYGTAFEFDARGVVSEDMDNDGRMDLLDVEMRQDDKLRHRGHALHVLKNVADSAGNHWIGVYLQEEGKGVSPLGAKVTVHTEGGKKVGCVANGQFSGSQHSNKLHFGLGKTAEVDLIEVRWPDGRVSGFRNPKIDQYHLVSVDDNLEGG